MKQYHVTGMSCAACQARVEKAVSSVPGVDSCAVSLLTNSMAVEGTASESDVISAVQAAGYGASLKKENNPESLEDRETPVLKRRLLLSIGFLLLLMYLTMGHSMLGLPLPEFLERESVSGWIQMILALTVMAINRKFFISGFRSLCHSAPNMDTLVALGSSVSFVWSVYAFLAGSGDLYFESAAMIPTLITVGKMLEARSKGRTTDAIRSLMQLRPQTAWVIRDGTEVEIPAEDLIIDDVFAVRPGESIPCDGIVLEGSSAVDESALTGESIPSDKAPGSAVSAATVNQSGYLLCRATRVGEDTALSQIIQLVSDAASTKAPIARIADRVSGIFVPAVVGIAAVTFIAWLIVGQSIGYAVARAVSVLVISCPCALGLATPVAIMVGNGVGARHGILFKTAVSLEETGKVQIAVFDKTGTLTEGRPRVLRMIPLGDSDESELLSAACALESKSEHPLSRAIAARAMEEKIPEREIRDFRVYPGNGLSGILDGQQIIGGSCRFLESFVSVADSVKQMADEEADAGRTPLFFARDGKLLGIISVADSLKEDSCLAVRQLKELGIETVMLTGDNIRTARAIGEAAGIDTVIAGVLPEGKEKIIRELQSLGKVAMIGDGINDAPALTSADIGIAIGAGTDVAIDAAEVVLMNSRLSDVPGAVRLSRATLKNIRENLFWAFFYNIIGIPLAAGCFIRLFGWQLNPMIGAAAMSLSSFCVVSNALRLNLLNPYAEGKQNKTPSVPKERLEEIVQRINTQKENQPMTKTMKIEGMMCPHCEAHTKKALESIEGVESAVASHEAGTAFVTLTKEVADDVLKKAVEEAGYTVLGIE